MPLGWMSFARMMPSAIGRAARVNLPLLPLQRGSTARHIYRRPRSKPDPWVTLADPSGVILLESQYPLRTPQEGRTFGLPDL